MTSMGDMSAASTTMPWGRGGSAPPLPTDVAVAPVGDLRRALTTSLTPRLRDLFLAAVREVLAKGDS